MDEFKADIEVYCRGGMQAGMTVAENDGTTTVYNKTGNALIKGATPAFMTFLWGRGWLQSLRSMAEIWAVLDGDKEPAPIKVGG